MTLETFFKENPVALLAFSGGVDSSYLLHAGLGCGAKIKAYFVKTEFQPESELRYACRQAEQIGVELSVFEKKILDNATIASNPENRCYYCKAAIFEVLQVQALAEGIPVIIDGTNASDNFNDRPGMKVLQELSIRSPLRECGIAKNEIRLLAKAAGLFTWNKPAYACLATRIPFKRTITKELLEQVEKAEDALFALGFTDFRARVIDESVKLQFPQEQMDSVFKNRFDIVKAVKPHFSSVLLDLEARYELL